MSNKSDIVIITCTNDCVHSHVVASYGYYDDNGKYVEFPNSGHHVGQSLITKKFENVFDSQIKMIARIKTGR